MVKNINTTPHLHTQIKKYEILTLLSIISSITPVDSLIISSIPLFSDKVKEVIVSNPSKRWMLRDVALLFHMSDSLFKRKLLEEGTSFSKILMESRMKVAVKLLNKNKSIKQTSIDCGFSNVSYFIQSFKNYYGATPGKRQSKIK